MEPCPQLLTEVFKGFRRYFCHTDTAEENFGVKVGSNVEHPPSRVPTTSLAYTVYLTPR